MYKNLCYCSGSERQYEISIKPATHEYVSSFCVKWQWVRFACVCWQKNSHIHCIFIALFACVCCDFFYWKKCIGIKERELCAAACYHQCNTAVHKWNVIFDLNFQTNTDTHASKNIFYWIEISALPPAPHSVIVVIGKHVFIPKFWDLHHIYNYQMFHFGIDMNFDWFYTQIVRVSFA